ncbi:MFS transporter, partial [Rhizobium rhizogenes]|uniref:MFS transporter n=1 Tax=Rhizobium rhizogenes TaxID=359 RepID=UPI001F18FF40
AMIPKSVCPLWLADIRSDPCRKARPSAVSYTTPVDTIMVADPAAINWPLTIAILTILVIYVTMVYGPIAAILVEMFPTRIRYTGMSLPYHIGNGWFGGLLPATVFAMSAAKGDIYYGLWYPIAIATMTLVIGLIFIRDTKGVDLNAIK